MEVFVKGIGVAKFDEFPPHEFEKWGIRTTKEDLMILAEIERKKEEEALKKEKLREEKRGRKEARADKRQAKKDKKRMKVGERASERLVVARAEDVEARREIKHPVGGEGQPHGIFVGANRSYLASRCLPQSYAPPRSSWLAVAQRCSLLVAWSSHT